MSKMLAYARVTLEGASALAAWMAGRIDEQEARRRVDAARLVTRERDAWKPGDWLDGR